MTSKVNIELQGAKFILLPDKGLTPLALFWIKNPSYLFVKNNIDKYVFNKKKYLECYVGDDFLNFEELMTNVKVVRASLTQREFLFLSCYYRNISALSISKLLNKNIKTIYYIKRKIERKIHIRLPKN